MAMLNAYCVIGDKAITKALLNGCYVAVCPELGIIELFISSEENITAEVNEWFVYNYLPHLNGFKNVKLNLIVYHYVVK